jgi:superfamily II DNA helicase RecQ
MSDDEFGWSPEDDEYLAATATLDAPGTKRRLDGDSLDRVPSSKRSRSDLKAATAPSPSTVLANKILKQRFGLNSFRLEQEKAITQILDGGSAVVVFPTGGGKSLCYQVSLAV